MPGQSVDRAIKRNKGWHPRVRFRQTGPLDLRLEVERVWKISVRKKMRESIEDVGGKVQRLPDFAGRASATIRNHVRGHGRAVFAVASVNFLDDAFTPIATRQIEIDIWPAFAALAQKTFEDEMIFDRINRRDAETKTNRAVRRTAPTLHMILCLRQKFTMSQTIRK